MSIHFARPAVDLDEDPVTAYIATVEPSWRRIVFTGRNLIALEGKHTTFKVISGLKPGSYTFHISAINEAGEGAAATREAVTVQ